MRVLIFGSRGWSDPEPIRRVVESLPDGAVVIHGAAPGADALAGELARARGLTVEVYPADWRRHSRSAGPIRNRQMLAEGRPDLAYGFRLDGPSPGTDDMAGRCRAAGVPVEVVVSESAPARARR